MSAPLQSQSGAAGPAVDVRQPLLLDLGDFRHALAKALPVQVPQAARVGAANFVPIARANPALRRPAGLAVGRCLVHHATLGEVPRKDDMRSVADQQIVADLLELLQDLVADLDGGFGGPRAFEQLVDERRLPRGVLVDGFHGALAARRLRASRRLPPNVGRRGANEAVAGDETPG